MGNWVEVTLEYHNLVNILVSEGYTVEGLESEEVVAKADYILRDWCKEVASRDYYGNWIAGQGGRMVYRFRYLRHATLFKLRWVGI